MLCVFTCNGPCGGSHAVIRVCDTCLGCGATVPLPVCREIYALEYCMLWCAVLSVACVVGFLVGHTWMVLSCVISVPMVLCVWCGPCMVRSSEWIMCLGVSCVLCGFYGKVCVLCGKYCVD